MFMLIGMAGICLILCSLERIRLLYVLWNDMDLFILWSLEWHGFVYLLLIEMT